MYAYAQVTVVVWQIGIYAAADAEAGITSFCFWEAYGFVIEGALVPVIVRPPSRLLYTLSTPYTNRGPGYLSDCHHHPRRAQQVANRTRLLARA